MRLGPAGGLDGTRALDHVCRGAWLHHAHPGHHRWRVRGARRRESHLVAEGARPLSGNLRRSSSSSATASLPVGRSGIPTLRETVAFSPRPEPDLQPYDRWSKAEWDGLTNGLLARTMSAPGGTRRCDPQRGVRVLTHSCQSTANFAVVHN